MSEKIEKAKSDYEKEMAEEKALIDFRRSDPIKSMTIDEIFSILVSIDSEHYSVTGRYTHEWRKFMAEIKQKFEEKFNEKR